MYRCMLVAVGRRSQDLVIFERRFCTTTAQQVAQLLSRNTSAGKNEKSRLPQKEGDTRAQSDLVGNEYGVPRVSINSHWPNLTFSFPRDLTKSGPMAPTFRFFPRILA